MRTLSLLPSALVALLLSSACASSAAAAQSSSTETPAAPPAAAVSIFHFDPNKYAVLHVTAAYEGGVNQLGKCPKQAPWGENISDYVNRHKAFGIGLKVQLPGAPEIQFNPINIDFTGGAIPVLSGVKCKPIIQEVDYTSPLYAMDRYKGQQIVVTPSLFANAKSSEDLKTALSASLSVLGTAAGFPAPLAAQAGAAAGRIVDGAAIDTSETFAVPFTISDTPLNTEKEWSVGDGILTQPSKMKIRIWMTVVDSFVTKGADQPWQPSIVTDTRVPIASASNPGSPEILGNYAKTYASAQFIAYLQATTAVRTEETCKALKERLQGLGLTNGDRALLMWAQTRETPATVTGGTVDATSCMRGEWAYLPAEIKPRVDPPIEKPPEPGTPPTTDQMRWIEREDGGVSDFFLLADPDARKTVAVTLFAYPAVIDGGTSKLFDPAQYKVESAGDWLRVIDKNAAILQRIGCYAYFNNGGTTESYMIAVGQAPAAQGGTETLVTLTFAAAQPKANALIKRIEVNANPTAAQREAMVKQRGGKRTCQNWSPAILQP